MSVNLHAHTKLGAVELWQTPSQIAHTILPSSISSDVTGKQAKEALLRYKEWVRQSASGVYTNKEEMERVRADVAEHLDYIDGILREGGLRVWVM